MSGDLPLHREFYNMSLDAYVKMKGGKTAINKVLIANNGIGAVKAIRSMKKWSYDTFGRDDVVKFVVMATPEDIKANAAFIHLADEFAQVPGGGNNNNYANVPLIVQIAERCGVQAVWPGWGHASENPLLPDMLVKAGIIWIGPPSSAMRALGDKIGSTLIAQSAGVRCLPWSGSGLDIDFARKGIPDDVYASACVTTAADAVRAGEKIGFPIMIKASEGGGGKGIRMCNDVSQIDFAFRQVVGEVPGSPIFLMKLAPTCRHLEVQLLADEWGDAIAIYGRDCSIQRRHQKIIEEGPVLAAPPKIWRDMEKAAIHLAKSVGYVGAGTVEYLYWGDGEYSFMELNPRLQVEHPVTELVSGVNLPAAQLQVAMGIPMHQIAGIRKMYGESLHTDTRIDFDNRLGIPIPGHTIACRITAENCDKNFQPTSGLVETLNFRDQPDVWGYFSVAANGNIHEFSDSQFGHVFAHGATREIARRNMAVALKELSIRGELRTTVEYLKTIVECDDFKENRITTTWLEQAMKRPEMISWKPEPHIVVILGAVFKAHQSCSANLTEYMDSLSRGQLPSPATHAALVGLDLSLIYDDTKYVFELSKSGPESYDVALKDWTVTATVVPLSDGGILVLLDGQKHIVYGQEFPTGLRLTVDGATCLFENEYDPTRLCSAMQGKLVRYLTEDGAHLNKGDPFAEMEVMKMFLAVSAPEAGVISHFKTENSVVEAGELIANLVLDDPEMVKKAADFEDQFPALREPNPLGDEVSLKLSAAVQALELVLDGYKTSQQTIENAIGQLMNSLRDPFLPLAQFTAAISSLTGRIPFPLMDKFNAISDTYRQACLNPRFHWEAPEPFPVLSIQDAIDNALLACATDADRDVINMHLNTVGVPKIIDDFTGGNQTYAVQTLNLLLERYLEVEKVFNGVSAEEVIKTKRKEKAAIDDIARCARSHHGLKFRTNLITNLLSVVERDMAPVLAEFIPTIRQLTTLGSVEYASVGLKARQLIMRYELPSNTKRKDGVFPILASAASAVGAEARLERLSPLLDQSQPIEDIMYDFFASRQTSIQKAAMELAVRRVFSIKKIQSLSVKDQASGAIIGNWTYTDAQGGNQRHGVMTYYRDFDALKREFRTCLDEFKAVPAGNNVLYVVARWNGPSVPTDEQMLSHLSTLLAGYKARILREGKIARITFVVIHPASENPLYYSVKSESGLAEDQMLRHIEPSYAVNLELDRLTNFKVNMVPTKNRLVHLFAGENPNATASRRGPEPGRLFARVLVRNLDSMPLYSEDESVTDQSSEIERAFLEALNAIEIAYSGDLAKYRHNHIFINVLVPSDLSLSSIQKIFRHLARSHSNKVTSLRVSHVELAIPIKSGKQIQPHRLYFSNPTGYMLWVDSYKIINGAHELIEDLEAKKMGHISEYKPYFAGKSITEPYPVSEPLQKQRTIAENTNTLYVYDYLLILEKACALQWRKHADSVNVAQPARLVHARELILNPKDKSKLVETDRAPGMNDIGMVAWRITLFTPFAPKGRDIVIISNDIAFQMGTFGTEEDELFNLASIYAREHQIPRLYFSANSGARIGLAEEVRKKFQIAWVNNTVTQGMDYIYLSEADYKELNASVVATQVKAGSEIRYRITDVIGATHGLGVENLSGSGKIAGETSSAYADIFTLTYVTGRSVGIGAYLARLGQRCIQKNDSPILLTGYMALNKLLGRSVYSSNLQLGGVDIMCTNGVSHQAVDTDLEGMTACIEWLNYVPASRNAPPPVSLVVSDPVDRVIDFKPTSLGNYDARNLIAGHMDGDSWVSGFFDKGSFTELLGGWAKTVVTGRARLGGYPIGIIATECRTVEQVVPADPADPASHERLQMKAGGVWYPDSAFKTAQAIRDMNAEDLPLMIFANWRGFSGGQQDMFDSILKYGADIVDALRVYQRPVFVYIPPFGTLRGGAWVVVDSTINADYMEMYADRDGRGGVLETEGTVEVKFRRHELITAAHRLDTNLKLLDEELKAAEAGNGHRAIKAIKHDIRLRENILMPYYHNVATAFADLHDTPGRMKAKNVIRCPVDWETSRSFFYWRMRRRLIETRIVSDLRAAQKSLSLADAEGRVGAMAGKAASDDRSFTEWADKNAASIATQVAAFRSEAVSQEIKRMVGTLDAKSKAALIASLK